MAYDSNNPFARIVRGELPCIRIFEDERTLAFMDIMPQTEGHALIVPKRAGENLLDTEPDDVVAAMLTTRRVAAAIDRAFEPKGIIITQFNRPVAGQTVFHLHFHVIPVYEEGASRAHARVKADLALLESHAVRIRAALA
jgi:histidine triad (HIT) family protein